MAKILKIKMFGILKGIELNENKNYLKKLKNPFFFSEEIGFSSELTNK